MALFGELEDAIDRPWEIAQRCQVKLEKVKEPFPRFDIPQEHTTDTYFDYVARQGFEKRRATPGSPGSARGSSKCPIWTPISSGWISKSR